MRVQSKVLLGIAAFVLAIIALGGSHAYAAGMTDTGPNFNYTNPQNNARYVLVKSDNTGDMSGMELPVYLKGDPSSNVPLRIKDVVRGNAPVNQYVEAWAGSGVNRTQVRCNNDCTLNIDKDVFVLDDGADGTNLYRAVVHFKLRNGNNSDVPDSFYRNRIGFRLDVYPGNPTAGLVGTATGNSSGYVNAIAGDPGSGSSYDYRIPFATPCTIRSNVTNTIELFDLDSGNADNAGGTVTVRVRNADSGAIVATTKTGSKGDRGRYYLSMTFARDGRYYLEVMNINSINMVQYKMPYDTGNFTYQCNPPTGSITVATCTQLAGTADDIDTSEQLRVQIIVDGDTGHPKYVTTTSGNWSYDDFVQDFKAHTYKVTVLGKSAVGIEDGENVVLGTKSIGPCARARCGTVTTVPASPGPSDAFTATIDMPYVNASGSDISITAPGVKPSRPTYKLSITGVVPNLDAVYTTSDTGLSYTFNVSAPHVASYFIGWNFKNSAGVSFVSGGVVCDNTTASSGDKPYFKVFNGDVNAAASFDNCATHGKTITAFNNGSSGNFTGSSGQIAAFAGGQIDQFASSSMNPNPVATPLLLTFAGTPGPTGYGGNFNCLRVSDFWDGTSPPLMGPQDISSATGPAVYVVGDVYISGSGISLGDGPWTMGAIPSYKLVAKGNIYIDPSVKRLDGLYVALKNGVTGGNVFTCAPTDHVSSLTHSWAVAHCGANQLRVNGSLLAEGSIKLLRTKGVLTDSSAAPQPEGPDTTTAAEVFIYSPEVWLHVLSDPHPESSVSPADSYISLPPVL